MSNPETLRNPETTPSAPKPTQQLTPSQRAELAKATEAAKTAELAKLQSEVGEKGAAPKGAESTPSQQKQLPSVSAAITPTQLHSPENKPNTLPTPTPTSGKVEGGIKGYIDNISKAIDLSSRVFDKVGFGAGISFLLAAFTGRSVASLMTKYQITDTVTGEAPTVATPETDQASESLSAPVIASLNVFRTINKDIRNKFSPEAKDTGESILNSKAFLSLNFQEVRGQMGQGINPDRSIKKDSALHRLLDTKLLKSLNLPSTKANYEAVSYALHTIYPVGEGFAQTQIKNQFKQVRQDRSILQAMEDGISDEAQLTATLAETDINQLSDGVGEVFAIDPATGEASGAVGATLNRHFSKKGLLAIMVNATAPLPQKFDPEDIGRSETLKQVDPNEIKKLIDFRSSLLSSIIANRALTLDVDGVTAEVSKEMNNLTYAETLKLYALMGGKTDTREVGGARQIILYTTIIELLQGNNDLAGRYKGAILKEIENLLKGNAVNIPASAMAFLKSGTTKVVTGAANTTWGAIEQWWGAVKENPISVTSATAALGAFIWYSKFLPVRTSMSQKASGMFAGK